jgi:hypothetical protein
MQIEIAKLGRMSQTGSSLMTLYQDKHTPILDLLVREAVQNSLDAGKLVDNHAEKKNFVEVSFLTGDFCPNNFNKILEGSTDALNKRYPEYSARFLAVRDKYTSGLTGPLRMSEVEDYKYGNLLKLVYDICKPQDIAGAGGSWGIGKSIYFRVGIGLVVYYSRIWDEKQNRFCSRFAVSIVEDEHSEDAIIPRDNHSTNTGIAWWGNLINEKETEPVIDEVEIDNYLQIFSIPPFKEKETGTVVIVPYIDENKLLTNNRIEETDTIEFESTQIIPTWMHSIEEYISIAVQRWYFPRLNNKDYIFGKYLKLYINDNLLRKSDMQPLFLCWQNLYNSAIKGRIYNDLEYINELDIKIEKISVRKYLEDTCAGYVAFTTLDRETLGMCPPDNLYSPYVYTDTDDNNGDSNRPLMAFSLMPGMVVNYKGNDEWIKSVPYSEKDKYIIAFFALNSNNKLEGVGQTLEEYVRKSELADHHSWEDYNTNNGKKNDIISKIKSQTSNKLSRAFEKKVDQSDKKTDSGWGQVMADLILPKEGFGTRSSRKNTNSQRLNYESHKSLKLALSEEDTCFYGDSMEFTYLISSLKKQQSFNLNLYISSESKSIKISEWINDGLELPFEINSVLVRLDKLDTKKQEKIWEINNGDTNVFDDIISLTNNKINGITYGLNIKFDEIHSFDIQVTFKMQIKSMKVKPLLKPE